MRAYVYFCTTSMKRIAVLLIGIFALISDICAQGLRGKVTDAATGEPIEFAGITVLPSKKFASTDEQGLWSVNLPAGNYRLIFSFVGYRPDTVSVCHAAIR